MSKILPIPIGWRMQNILADKYFQKPEYMPETRENLNMEKKEENFITKKQKQIK